MATLEEAQPDTRGIQNTHIRFKERIKNRLTSEQLQSRAQGTRDTSSVPERVRTVRDELTRKKFAEERRRTALEEVLRKTGGAAGIPYEEGTVEMLIENPPIRPDFPYIMVSLAILKDVLDAGDFFVVGIIVTTILSFTIALVLFLWFLGKLSGGWWKKKMVAWLWTRYAVAIFIEFVPFLKIIPATTILVFMAHYRETKIVQFLNSALENLRKKGVPDL